MRLSLNSLGMIKPVSAIDLLEQKEKDNMSGRLGVPGINVMYAMNDGNRGYLPPNASSSSSSHVGDFPYPMRNDMNTSALPNMPPPMLSSSTSIYSMPDSVSQMGGERGGEDMMMMMGDDVGRRPGAYAHSAGMYIGQNPMDVMSGGNVNMSARNFYKVPKKFDTLSDRKRVENELQSAALMFSSLAGKEYKERIKEILNSVNETEESVKTKTMHSEYSQTLMRLKYSCYFPREIKVIYDPIVFFTKAISKGSKNDVWLCQNDRYNGCDFYGVPSTSDLSNTIVGEMNMTYFNNPTNKTLGLLISNKIKNKTYYLTGGKYVDHNSTERYHLIIPPKTKIVNPVNIYRNVFNNSNDYCQLYTYLTPDPASIDKDVHDGFMGEKLVPVDHPIYKYIVENAPMWENWNVPKPESKYNNTRVCVPGAFYEEVKDRLLEIIKIYYPVTNLSTLTVEFRTLDSNDSDIAAIDELRDHDKSTNVEGMVQILFGFRR